MVMDINTQLAMVFLTETCVSMLRAIANFSHHQIQSAQDIMSLQGFMAAMIFIIPFASLHWWATPQNLQVGLPFQPPVLQVSLTRCILLGLGNSVWRPSHQRSLDWGGIHSTYQMFGASDSSLSPSVFPVLSSCPL